MSANADPASSEPRYAGPHPWQIRPLAGLVRRAMSRRAYRRWVDRYCDPLTVTGRHHFDGIEGPCIVIANHQSHMDTLVLHEALPPAVQRNLFFGAAADRWYVRRPLGQRRKLVLEPWYQSLVLGNFPIRRGGGSPALDYARWLLEQGRHICVFPEGTRASTEALGRFRPGVVLLALEYGVPVVPVYLSGLQAMRPKGQLEVRRGPAGAEFLEAVRFAAGTRVEEACAELWSRMNERHLAHHPGLVVPEAVPHAA